LYIRKERSIMAGKISRWGNSVAVRIPKAVLEQAGLCEGQTVDVVAGDGTISVRPVSRMPKRTLAELVAEMERLGPESRPESVDWGRDVGAEILPEDEYSRGEITLEDILNGAARSKRG